MQGEKKEINPAINDKKYSLKTIITKKSI